MTLKLFSGPDGEPSQLDSLTIAGDPGTLRLLAGFLARVADEIDAKGPTMRHQDFRSEPGILEAGVKVPQILVSRCV